MTGYASVDTAVHAMKLGAVDYLVKPVFDDTLLGAVDRALGQSESGGGAALPGPGDVRRPTRDQSRSALEREAEGRRPLPDALAQWVEAVCRALKAPDDPKHVSRWAAMLGVAPGRLRMWCRAAGVPAKGSLDLARVPRGAWRARRDGGSPSDFLAVGDPRTLARLLRAAGIDHRRSPVTVEDVLDNQTLV
jgi:hypothetical protein